MEGPGGFRISRALGVALILLLLATAIPGLPSTPASARGVVVPCPGVLPVPLAAPGPSVLSPEPGPGPTAPCPGNEIAYVEQGGFSSIVVMYPNGTNKGTVYHTKSWALGPLAWSPDSRSIAFAESGHLWRIGLGLLDGRFVGMEPMLLTETPMERPSWSPLGHEILGVAGRSLGVVFRTGGAIQTLYTPPTGNTVDWPTYNWAGTQIAFVETDPTGVSSIKIMDRDTRVVLRTLVRGLFNSPEFLDWARMGRQTLAFSSDAKVYFLDVDTGAVTLVVAGRWPNWAPNNAKLVHYARNSGDSLSVQSGNLVVRDLVNGTTTVVARSGIYPEWNLVAVPPLEDAVPPDPVSDLAVDASKTTRESVTLNWTATGDDGVNGTAFAYDVRYVRGTVLTEATWGSARQALGEPLPLPSGSLEAFTVNGLLPGTTYTFGIKVADELFQWSALSNVVTATTLPWPWAPEVIGFGGAWAQMVLDGSGNPHLSYNVPYVPYNEDWYAVYTHRVGSNWSVETIPDTAHTYGRFTSIAVDAAGNPHITYLNEGSGGPSPNSLTYATKSDAGWRIETVDQQGDAGIWNSIAIDRNGRPHVSYRQGWTNSAGALKYAHWTGSAWSIEVVDPANGAGLEGTSIALDSQDRPRIAYFDTNLNALRYATWTGAAWVLTTVEVPSSGSVSSRKLTLRLDLSDRPHIGYCANGDVWYAAWSGLQWNIRLVDPEGDCELGMVLDAAGNPHFSYYIWWPDDVRYAHWTGTEWGYEDIDGLTTAVGWESTIAMTPDGKVFVAYMDIDRWELKFARRV